MDKKLPTTLNGYDVYGADGKKIGSVKECAGDYCRIDTGFLGLGRDYFIPLDAIADAEPGEIHLTVTADRLDRMGWDQSPLERVDPEPQWDEVPIEEEEAASEIVGVMPLTEERLVPKKTTHVYGEIEIEKQVITEKRRVGDTVETVRREVPVIREKGDVRRSVKSREAPHEAGPGADEASK